MFFEPEILR